MESLRKLTRSKKKPNLSIENFDKNGLVFTFNQTGDDDDYDHAPFYVCNSIDPNYTYDANKRQKTRKFKAKSDVTKLRDITRKKLTLYKNEEESMKRFDKNQQNILYYQSAMQFYETCFHRLDELERTEFREMRKKYDEHNDLQQENLLELERNRLRSKLQQISTETIEIYWIFLHRLKIIDYFDNDSEERDSIAKFRNNFTSEKMFTLGTIDTAKALEIFTKFSREVLFPYLEKRTDLNHIVWMQGFQNLKHKLSNYNRHVAHLALLAHFLRIIQDRLVKFQEQQAKLQWYKKSLEFSSKRNEFLRKTTIETVKFLEEIERNDERSLKISAIVPILCDRLQLTGKIYDIPTDDDANISLKIIKIQDNLIDLQYKLDSVPQNIYRQCLQEVRERYARDRKQARKSFILHKRFGDLIQHYRQHLKKNV